MRNRARHGTASAVPVSFKGDIGEGESNETTARSQARNRHRRAVDRLSRRPETIARFPVNGDDCWCAVRIGVVAGAAHVDLRIFRRNPDGALAPTASGFAIHLHEFHKLRRGVLDAYTFAVDAGLFGVGDDVN